MKLQIEQFEADNALKLIRDAEFEKALSDLRTDLEEQMTLNETLRIKELGLKQELHKTDFVKQKRYGGQLEQFEQAQGLCKNLDKDEDAIEKLQDSRTRALDTNENNVKNLMDFKTKHTETISRINLFVSNLDVTTKSFSETVNNI